MAANLGNAYVNIVPKAPDIENNIENLLNGGSSGAAAENAGKGWGKKILGGLLASGLAAGAGKIISDAFEAGGALQQSFGGLETIYGDAAGAAQEYAMQAAAAGISANDYAEQAVSFGAALKKSFGGDTAKAAEAANTAILDMADNAAKMGTPLESIQAAYQGFARGQYQLLDNLKLGYGGTKTEMERLLADAQTLTGVEYDIDNLGDVYEAIHVIQGELGLTGVAASEAETTLTGSAGAVKASWENLMGALTTGEGLETAMSGLTESVGNFAGNVLTMLGELGPQLPDLILGLADIVIENAPDFIASGAELIVQLAIGLIGAIPDLVKKIPEIIDGVKKAFTDHADEWKAVGEDILKGVWEGIKGWASTLWNNLKEVVRGGVNAAQQVAEIGSPSKLFADEVGRWIPAGIAMGVEENTTPLDRAMQGMMDESLTAARSDLRPAQVSGGSDADRIIAALQELRLQANVRLDGDARKIFKVVRDENNTVARAVNMNPLSGKV